MPGLSGPKASQETTYSTEYLERASLLHFASYLDQASLERHTKASVIQDAYKVVEGPPYLKLGQATKLPVSQTQGGQRIFL